jgi:hypothetical protein
MWFRSKRRDAKAIAFHYDVSNDFYALFLDRRMVYTCAYYRTPDGDLDQADHAQAELVAPGDERRTQHVEAPARPEVPHVRPHLDGDVHRLPARERRSGGMGRPAIALLLPSGADPRAAAPAEAHRDLFRVPRSHARESSAVAHTFVCPLWAVARSGPAAIERTRKLARGPGNRAPSPSTGSTTSRSAPRDAR